MTSVTTKKNRFQYQCIEGRPRKEILQEFVELNHKIGFQNEPYVFESWRGGVTKEFRGQGIATHLMKLQHQWCKNKNFRKIITVTNTNNTAMMLLNSKHGFEVIQHTTNHRNIQKVHFQKDLQ